MAASRQFRNWLLTAGTAAAGAVFSARPLTAQTVVEVEGGGSSLLGGYGATANFWRTSLDGWIGIGYLHGLRLGASVRTAVNKDTLRVGNDALVMRFPTDIFSAGSNLLVQGVSYSGSNGSTSYLAFAGASSGGLGAPSFQPTDIEQPMGALFVERKLSPTVRVTGSALIASRQTVIPGIQWQPSPDVTGALVFGIGSDRPYTASSLVLRRGRLGVKALYAWNPNRFRRAAVPSPNQTEVDRENIALTYDLGSEFQVGVSRQNFVQDSSDLKPAVRASGNSVFAGGRWHELRLTAGLYDSRSQGLSNLSSYFALGRQLRSWLDAELFLLQSRPEGLPATTTPVANLRWRVSPKVGLMQQVSFHAGRPTVLLGASLRTAIGEFSADYQIVHQPFQPFNPFRSSLNLSARLQLGSYSTSLGTYIQPDGSVDYSASGSTFLYLGAFGGVQPARVGGPALGRYVVRGAVRDEQGAPVEGAALDVGGEIAFTNSKGEFFVRVRRPQWYDLAVRVEEFLLPGRWEVLSAPARTQAEQEETARGVEVQLRRVVPPPPLPAEPAPATQSDTLLRTEPGPTDTAAVLPPPPPPRLFSAERPVLTLREVRFETGMAVMVGRSLPVLDSIAGQLIALPDLRIEVGGHTDSTGTLRRNIVLSRARAEAVRLYLHRQGVPLERMVARGYGPLAPVATNRTAAGRAENRRVELRRLPGGSAGP